MIDQSNEAAIRARAYQLWEEGGRADGSQHQHWRQAEAEYSAAAGKTVLTADELTDVSAKAERHEDGISPLPAQDNPLRQPRRVKIPA